MSPLASIALRYLAWLIGLRILYAVVTSFTAVPNTLGTVVILAAAPAVEIAMYAMRKASAPIAVRDWVRIWAVMLAVYVLLDVAVPAILLPQARSVLLDGSGLGNLLIVTASTGAMLALFLWVGTRTARRASGG